MRRLLKKIAMLAMAGTLCMGMVLPASASEATDKVEVSYSKKVWNAEEANVPGAKIINPIGFAGMQITVGAKDIEVTAIGRWYTVGSALTTRNFMIHDTEGNVVLDYGTATCTTTGLEEEGFVYANIEGGVTLKANTTYYLVSDFWGENDKFYTASVTEHTDAATLDGIAILNPETNEFEFYNATDIGWGPMDFKYMADRGDVEPEEPDKQETPKDPEPSKDTDKIDNDSKEQDKTNTKPEKDQKDTQTSGVSGVIIGVVIAVVVVIAAAVVVIIIQKKKKNAGSKRKAR